MPHLSIFFCPTILGICLHLMIKVPAPSTTTTFVFQDSVSISYRANGRQSTSLSVAFLEAPICQLSLCIPGSVCVTCLFFTKYIASHTKIKFLVNLGKKETRVFIASHDGDFCIVTL